MKEEDLAKEEFRGGLKGLAAIIAWLLPGAGAVMKLLSHDVSPLVSLQDYRSSIKPLVGLYLWCFIAVLIGTIAFLWQRSLLGIWTFNVWGAAVKDNWAVTLALPSIALAVTIAIVFSLSFLQAWMLKKDYKVDYKTSLLFSSALMLFMVALADIAVLLDTISIGLFAGVSGILNFNRRLAPILITAASIFIFVVAGYWSMKQYERIFTLSLGAEKNRALKTAVSNARGVALLVIAISVVGEMIMSQLIYDSAFHALGERGRAIQSAQLRPVNFTINRCIAQDDQIVCAISIRPDQFQDYTLFGSWDGRVEAGRKKDGTIPVLASASVSPRRSTEFVVPTVHIDPQKITDIEVVIKRSDGCMLARTRAANDGVASIFLQASGRSNEFSQTPRIDVRFRPDSDVILLEELKALCAA